MFFNIITVLFTMCSVHVWLTNAMLGAILVYFIFLFNKYCKTKATWSKLMKETFQQHCKISQSILKIVTGLQHNTCNIFTEPGLCGDWAARMDIGTKTDIFSANKTLQNSYIMHEATDVMYSVKHTVLKVNCYCLWLKFIRALKFISAWYLLRSILCHYRKFRWD